MQDGYGGAIDEAILNYAKSTPHNATIVLTARQAMSHREGCRAAAANDSAAIGATSYAAMVYGFVGNGMNGHAVRNMAVLDSTSRITHDATDT